MFNDFKSLTYLSGALPLALFGAMAASTPAAAACQGPGAPTTAQTRCVTAIAMPTPLQSWDISWVNPQRAEYYLGDRSNNAIDIIDTEHLTFKRSLGQGLFRGVVLKNGGPAIDTTKSGPNGVVTHGRWVYAGDGDSTLKVFDLDSPPATALKATVNTGGSFRLDEMALTTDGRYLVAANNAENIPFVTLFRVNGDDATNSVSPASIIQKTVIDSSILPAGFGSIEQPTWDPKTQRFYTSIPTIAANPTGCGGGGTPCSGGLLVTDPLHPNATETAFNSTTNTGVVKLINCGPNGATTADFDNLLLGCDSANLPGSTTTTVINAKTKNQTSVQGIVGSDEVWFNEGDDTYYLATRQPKQAGSTLGSGSVLGVVNITSVLVETIPQSSGTHSVAADSKRNRIFVPQAFTSPGSAGSDSNTINGGSQTVGQQLCGSTNGCVVVYEHDVDDHHDARDDHGDHGDHS